MPRKSGQRRLFCSPTRVPESRARRFTSIAATTLWDSEWPVVRDPWGGVPSAGQTETTATDLWPSGLGRFDSANSNDMQKLTIAIDGPAGSGKSSVARLVAGILGYLYLDSGAMYRALALKALERNVPLDHEAQLEKLANETHIELKPPTPEQEKDGIKNRVFLDGKEVTQAIRTPEVAQAASRLATIAGVRAVLVAEQQRAGDGGAVVMEGRDIGTVGFPNAELKIFLEASPEVRAERRWKEHQEKGENTTLAQ